MLLPGTNVGIFAGGGVLNGAFGVWLAENDGRILELGKVLFKDDGGPVSGPEGGLERGAGESSIVGVEISK